MTHVAQPLVVGALCTASNVVLYPQRLRDKPAVVRHVVGHKCRLTTTFRGNDHQGMGHVLPSVQVRMDAVHPLLNGDHRTSPTARTLQQHWAAPGVRHGGVNVALPERVQRVLVCWRWKVALDAALIQPCTMSFPGVEYDMPTLYMVSAGA
eukprot:530295-Rhodomonas_salina.3